MAKVLVAVGTWIITGLGANIIEAAWFSTDGPPAKPWKEHASYNIAANAGERSSSSFL